MANESSRGGPGKMTIAYHVVPHDGGWAYQLDGTFSESYPTHDEARDAAYRVAKEHRLPGEYEVIEYQDASGVWRQEVAADTDRPDIAVEDDFADVEDVTDTHDGFDGRLAGAPFEKADLARAAKLSLARSSVRRPRILPDLSALPPRRRSGIWTLFARAEATLGAYPQLLVVVPFLIGWRMGKRRR